MSPHIPDLRIGDRVRVTRVWAGQADGEPRAATVHGVSTSGRTVGVSYDGGEVGVLFLGPDGNATVEKEKP